MDNVVVEIASSLKNTKATASKGPMPRAAGAASPAFPASPDAGRAAGARAMPPGAGGSRAAPVASAQFSAPPLEILRGLRDIAAFLQISHREVLELENSGAPIVRHKNILRAEKRELWSWFRENSGAV